MNQRIVALVVLIGLLAMSGLAVILSAAVGS
jgi:hypothetical protein